MVNKFKAISLYTGAGGMDIGFDKAGFDIIWSNDIDPFSVETHKILFPNCSSTVGDIRKQKLPDIQNIDLIFGGPPCQGFSVAGKMDPNDPRSKHVWDFLGIVKKLQPKAFVMENVKSLACNQRWVTLRDSLIEAAKSIGYQTNLYVLDASDYEVPQKRERMFLVGIKNGKIDIPKKVSSIRKPKIIDVLEKIPTYGTKGNDALHP